MRRAPEQEADDDERQRREADVAENSESKCEPEQGGKRTFGRSAATSVKSTIAAARN